MNIKQLFNILLAAILITSCTTVQETWKTDTSIIEKDILDAQKDGLVLFTASDSNEQSKKLLDSLTNHQFFSKSSKEFVLYNVDIVKDESKMPTKDLKRNYTAFSDYGITYVPQLCLMTTQGDVYHLSPLPEDIVDDEKFYTYSTNLKEKKGIAVSRLRSNIEETNGIEKIKAIDTFFNEIYFADSEKYRPLFNEGIKNDPENKSGLRGKFILAVLQLNIDPLLLQNKHTEAVQILKNSLTEYQLRPNEIQWVWASIAYISTSLSDVSKEVILSYLEKAFSADPTSEYATAIKDDIEYLKSKKE